MPNYRKKKQSHNNRNKNKNKSNTTSSSVKQESSEFDSVGIRPNLPANENVTCIGIGIGIDSTTSTSGLDVGKGVVAVVGDSSPSSYEEIGENACIADTVACSSNKTTAVTQSNYSSSFCSSTSKKSTEIEQNSARSVIDGDSALGSSVITDSVEADSLINSLKTGSAHTKDAAVPTATRSATRSIEITGINEEGVDGNRSVSERIRDDLEPLPGSEDRVKEVIVLNEDQVTGPVSSKITVQKTIQKRSVKSVSSAAPVTTEKTIETVIVQEIPKVIFSDVIVEKISNENSSQLPSEETKFVTDNITTQKAGDQSPKAIVQQTTKKKAVRTTTASLKDVKNDIDESSTSESDQTSKVVFRQGSKEGGSRRVSFDLVPQEISTVIIHQISREDSEEKEVGAAQTSNESCQKLDSVNRQANSDDPPSSEVKDTKNTTKCGQNEAPISEKLVSEPIEQENILDQKEVESSKVIVIPISLQTSTQTSPSICPATLTKTVQQNQQQTQLTGGDQSEKNELPKTTSTKQAPNRPKEIVIPISLEESTQTSPLSTSLAAEVDSPAKVVFEQLSRQKSPEPNLSGIPANATLNSIGQVEPGNNSEVPVPPTRTAFPVCRSPKVLVHQILREGSPKPVFPFTPRSLEKLDDSSKEIASQILKDVSAELKSSFQTETATRTVVKKEVKEEVRTAFPVTTQRQGPIRPGYFETTIFEKESNPVVKEASKSKNESEFKQSSLSTRPKVIVHEISKTPPQFPPSTYKAKTETPSALTEDLEAKVIVHQISREDSVSEPSPKQRLARSDSITISAWEDVDSASIAASSAASDSQSKVIVHKIIQEEPKTDTKSVDPQTKPVADRIKNEIKKSPSFPFLADIDDHLTQLKPKTDTGPTSSGASFPLSSSKELHPTQYIRTGTELDAKIKDLKTLRSECELRQTSSTLTSPFAVPVTAENKDNSSQSSTTLFPAGPLLKKKVATTPVANKSFPLSIEAEVHEDQYRDKPADLEPTAVHFQVLRDGSELRQSSSTLTSPHALTVTAGKNDNEYHSDSQGKQILTKESPLLSFPISADQEIHKDQYISKQKDSEAKTGDFQTFRDESELRQSSSTLTSPYAINVTASNDDNKPLSKSEVITTQQKIEIQHDSSSSSSSSEGSVLTAIHLKSPPSQSSPDVVEDQKEKVNTKDKSPRSSFFLASLELTNQAKPDKSDSSDTETLRGGSETPPDPEENLPKKTSTIPNDQSPKVIVHQISIDSTPTATPEVHSPKVQQNGQSQKVIIHQISIESPTTIAAPEISAPKIISRPIVTEKSQPEPGKVIIHPILREIVTDKTLAYRVESPQPDRSTMIVRKSKSFDDDDIVIQEMSDTSSAGDTDNPPVVSEAESETDTLEAIDEFPDTPINSRVLSVQTLPIDHEDESMDPMSPGTAQDYKIRRKQNRAALESHFMPQFLSPIFLDSIKEENSDLSDSERRSECSDRTDHAVQQGDLEDDVFAEGGPHAKKADAVFPKSNLDFSKKHKNIHTSVRPPKTTIIREEVPPASVVEAKIIDQGSVEESCSSWSTDLTPQSEAAEVVYIDSASSSVSDLLELDYSQGQPDEPIDVRIQTPTIDLESVNEMFSYRQSESNERIKTPPPPPVKEDESKSEHTLLPPLTSAADRVDTTTTEIKTTEQKSPDEIILEKIETMSETVASNDDVDIVAAVAAAAADRAPNSKANNPNSCDSAINEVVPNDIASIAVGFIEKMENLRELISASAAVQSESDTISDTDRDVIKPNFKIGQPCSDHTLKCDTTNTSSSLSSSSCTTTTTTTTTGKHILTLHDLSKTLGDTKHLHPLGNSSSALDRQESLDSHGSDQSQSTNQSQCTAIHQASLPHSDWNEVDTTTDTTYVSESDTAAGLASSENSSPLTLGGGDRSGYDTESPPIRKLRSLCTEALASMPYGEEVLEELATVAQNIGDMPYPLPELPHIKDIQVSLKSEPRKSSVITLSQVPPGTPPVCQKFKSPPPPPVPEPPSKYDSWLGVPTENDPNVLVCLSPSQRSAVKNDATPDSLLDMHKKFVERRGYHEFTTQQVNAMNREKSHETVTLSKSNSPPPPLPPRPQQPAEPLNGNGIDINADDQNNHRLLAIIRDTHGGQQQQQPNQHHPQQQKSSSENISRRTESESHTTIKSTNTTTATTNDGGGRKEFANTPAPAVSKQTQERFVSESNQSQSAQHEMQTGKTEHIIKIDREPVMGLRFPTSDYFDSIFDGNNKRFSNIETSSSPGFCSQILSTKPKRYSNIETSSYENRKCVENGKVLYDVSDSNRQTVREGEKPDDSVKLTSFPELKTKINGFDSFPFVSSSTDQVDSSSHPRPPDGDSGSIMSAFKLNTEAKAPPPVPAPRVEASPPAPPVPPLPSTLVDSAATTTTTTRKSTSTSESVKNRNFNAETKETNFSDFGQRAKEASAGEQRGKKHDVFDHEKLFKDFDELSNLLKDELESGKRRPPATLNGNEIPASVSDYNRVARESKIQSSHVSSSTSEQSRREQMKKLAEEIDRTAMQRQQARKEMRIPIRIQKPTPTPPRAAAPIIPQQPRSYEVPHQVDAGSQQRVNEIPVRVEEGSRPRTLQHQRSYEIPVRVEHQTGARQRTRSEHQTSQRSHEAPTPVERPREQPERFRRAESMFNISDSTSQRHMLHDDWVKYVGDVGSSDNICKPFQREVEICYMGRRPNIRAPRLSASTSDLSSSQSYDAYGAYDVRRTTTTQTPRPQEPPRRRYLSSQSLIDTTPITSCVSARRSPVPERRSSLPRELHDQQLKYISSKEHQLQLEFERLENERRQLIDEMNRAQISQRMNREAYRQRQLPPLTEDESFRQQMAEEWLDKVAEREERRLQKIIKISKINQDANLPAAPPRRVSSSDIGDEFLRRVKERRSKLCMPSDSDWESGAESQPVPRHDGSRSETDEPPSITVLEGQAQADIKQLPKHLREFAKLTSQMKEEHHEETTENTSCSAVKKSSVVTTVKTSNTNNQHTNTQDMSQQDAARVGDLEQLPQGRRQKLVTILRPKKQTESSSAGGCQSVATTAGAGSHGGGTSNSAKRRKQTRFLLTPNRRSWSESDLLREIDKELVLAKGFLYANGVWTPKNQTPTSSRTNLNEFQPLNHTCSKPSSTTNSSDKISENRSASACGGHQKGIPTPPPPPLWTPQPERKQFRPVHFESPKPQRRYVRQQSTPGEATPPPWSYTNSQPFPGYQSQSCTNLSQKSKAIPWPPPSSSSAAAQNGTGYATDDPVVDDDCCFSPSSSIADKIKTFERSTSNTELHRPFVRLNPYEKPATLRPNEVIYSLKNEYMSEPETEYDRPKKMAQLSRRQYDGIGPTTRDGMPVVLRSEVKEPNQHEWYKRIFQTIHKQKNPDDYVTIRYKCPRGRYPYKSNGYMSEPEPNYDSDYSTVKYRTLERRRLQSTGTGTGTATPTAGIVKGHGNDSQYDTFYGTMPNPVKSGQGSYKVQPGRIEDYITGHSSVSEKEKKEWWDEVMDIFNGWLKDNDRLPRVFIEFANEVERFQLDQQKLSPHYTEGNLSRALLKEQGYTSDSNLVFRKKDVPQQQSPLSPVEQKQVYKIVQAGGQPPLLGFRKAAPEKPKETEFEYLPITPTLTKIRVHSKEAMSKQSKTTHAAKRELICYPITNLSRPIDMFAPFPKHVPSFIPINQPPLPPNRKSSRARTTSMALKVSSSEVRRPTSANSSRHEACFQTKDAISPPPPKPAKYGTITLRKTVSRTEPLHRSKSAGAVVSLLTSAKEEKSKDGRVSRKQQTIRLSSCSPVRSASRLSTLRTSSRSPVAFGRSVSKERSFAEEKKRIEEAMPSLRTDFTASTNILRDPSLKSPDQVKRAVRSYAYPMERSKSAPRVLSPTKPAILTYMSTYSVRRVPSPSRKELPNVRRGQSTVSIRPPVKTTVVVRSKSQSSRLPEKKPMTKAGSSVSLARTSSTFSVDSTTSKVKPVPKKPLTITRPPVRTETEKPKRKPVTICSSKSESNVMHRIKESSEVKEKIVKAIPGQQKIIRTDHFFKNLFMRDESPKKYDEPERQPIVSEKSKYWNTMSLPTRKTTTDSGPFFIQQYRSLSPPVRPPYVEEYESMEHYNTDDEVSEFGDQSGRTEALVWQYEQRGRSEPRSRPITDIARPDSPGRMYAKEFSPTREIRIPQTREMRSPSRRRIQNFRGSQRGETGKVIRASSLSSADDRSKRSLYHCEDISHSANSLEYIERHSPSCRFKTSDRFIDLNRFYSTLERVGQLERATSTTSLKPIRKEGEAIDFDEWRKIRFHERAERELNYLVGRLKEDQKHGDFLFRPKDVEDVKWSGNKDLSLRSKDKSVEDLRENFEKKIHQEWLDESKRQELESRKDTYKPYWRGSSVADLASSMEVKYNPDSGSFGVQKLKSENNTEKPLCLSNRLMSTLSRDQVSKITQQLNEIYNASEPKTKPDVTEEYVITVDKKTTPANALKVRCNSSISKEELIGPVLRRKEEQGKPSPSKSSARRSQDVSELSESEKRRLSQTFSREIQGLTRSGSPVMLARETRGAIAAENAKSSMSEIPPPPPLPKDLIEPKKPVPVKPKRKLNEDKKPNDQNAIQIETVSTETVEKPEDTVSKKIQYFEDRQFEEPAKTIYHAREDSSPDEDEVMRVIEENIKARAQSSNFHHQEMSSSVTDLKDLYGERESSRINFPLPRPPPPPDETLYTETKQDKNRSTSLTLTTSRDGSLENLEALFRSRSISPQSGGTSYLHRVHTGDVRKIKDKFESLGRPKKKKNHFFAISPLRKVRSDPELSNDGSKDTFKTIVREHELGDVSWIAHKFEERTSTAGRGRSRFRKPGSPIQRMPLRKEDRLMPHIDIISKTASLKQEMMKSQSPSPTRQQATLHAGEVERIRCIFETSPDRESPLRQPSLGTSSPELRDISAHLTASWYAHKYPKRLDNDLRSPPPEHEHSSSLPHQKIKHHERTFRSRSISPPKLKQKSAPITSILKPRYDFFANQKFDPSIHRPKARYVPDSGEDPHRKTNTIGLKKTSAVKFKDDDVPPPPVPPHKGVSLDSNGFSNLESPNRYFESDVNIHYKTPIRYEYKDPIPEEELAIRQAEQMQKLYQEERRRKYLQELQDMNSRRHTDNFTSTQKSPIPLNRYDDFNSDLAPKSPNSSNYPKTIARALYNFQGQTARELTFKKGDVIYIRRQIDKNWYEGEHNAMIGLLPSNYVELISKDGVRQPPKKPSEGQARAKYNFQAQSGIELSLNKGELVTLTRRVDDNWFEGKIANRKGIFPVSYVEVLVDIGAEDKMSRAPASQSIITQSSLVRPSLDTLRTNINNEFNSLTSNGQHPNGILRETRTLHKTEVLHVDTNTEPVAYRALYKYRPQNTDELELQEGDIVLVLEKCDDGWFVGTSQRSGCFGTFPGNYVELV